ncbi:MAG: RNA 2',3'-cyclic phosphodiesterase [Pseudomonadota bacterium]
MSNNQQRLFFALWPDASTRARLAAIRDQRPLDAAARKTPDDDLHITLAFLGACSAQRRACAEQAAQQIHARPFTLSLEQLGYWSKPRILWFGAAQSPPELLDLVRQLQEALRACDFTPEARPYQAHVTLARDTGAAARDNSVDAVTWQVADFALVESRNNTGGARYQVLRRWPLQDTYSTGTSGSLPHSDHAPG